MTIFFKRPTDGEHDKTMCARSHCRLPAETLFSQGCFGSNRPTQDIGLCDDCAAIVRNEWTPEPQVTV